MKAGGAAAGNYPGVWKAVGSRIDMSEQSTFGGGISRVLCAIAPAIKYVNLDLNAEQVSITNTKPPIPRSLAASRELRLSPEGARDLSPYQAVKMDRSLFLPPPGEGGAKRRKGASREQSKFSYLIAEAILGLKAGFGR